ncbi:Gfo/Idh/MocA family oxidoreductase [Actinacidiphila sp. DG2A-62]|uniref:Gfo/Idh/MocA family protein n=1 Tax=Actinacidiphila sp. DG2A-62 TaxID=3108821 RepID=UPI002DBB99DD|nr:Gfo/Idh/MocA family oxidoreductase [Actinacidiphila sp. DG2A-62]MEC3996985.1 Gfo/Idh/MocA family oxidoreductase [Actinacidiphila sp. DG2A-62]
MARRQTAHAPARAPLPVVLVGAGKVAHAAHLREIRDLPDALRLAAVVEHDPDRLAAVRAGFPAAAVCADLAEAVRAGARAALVCTPWWTHASVLAACLDLGLPVLCEKPVSLDLAEIDALIAAERAAGVPVAAGDMKRHDPVVALFVAHCREHLDRARRLAVDIHDPNAPHQVAHLLPYQPPPFGPQPPAARRALAAALGPQVGPGQREAYARGLGGSLIHQVNIVHAALAGSGLALAWPAARRQVGRRRLGQLPLAARRRLRGGPRPRPAAGPPALPRGAGADRGRLGGHPDAALAVRQGRGGDADGGDVGRGQRPGRPHGPHRRAGAHRLPPPTAGVVARADRRRAAAAGP